MPRLWRIPKARLQEPLDIMELLELGAGPIPGRSRWSSDAERRPGYLRHRDEILERWRQHRPGDRGWAFWYCEVGVPELVHDVDESPIEADEYLDPEDWMSRYGGTEARERIARRRRFAEKRLTFLALNGLLDEDEIRRLLAPRATHNRSERWQVERTARIVEQALRERELLLEAQS